MARRGNKTKQVVIGLVAGGVLLASAVGGVVTYKPNHNPNPTPSVTAVPTESDLSPAPTGGATPVLPANTSCDNSLWQHIYHPQRLQVIEACKTITGTVANEKAEADGDFHVRIKLDPGEEGLLNNFNTSGQKGYLVVEPVCENPVSQKDAVATCNGFKQTLNFVPGKHYKITGAYVTDLQHGWNEIHPVTSITEIK